MKKIFTLLAVIMASLTAMAQTTFYGTWKNNSNSFPSFDNYVEVTVNDNGTCTIVLKNIVFGNDILEPLRLTMSPPSRTEQDIASLWATRPLSTSPKAIWAA